MTNIIDIAAHTRSLVLLNQFDKKTNIPRTYDENEGYIYKNRLELYLLKLLLQNIEKERIPVKNDITYQATAMNRIQQIEIPPRVPILSDSGRIKAFNTLGYIIKESTYFE